MAKTKAVTEGLKKAKNYVKKKIKGFREDAPKAKPKAKPVAKKVVAKPSAQNKATNTNKANTGGSKASMKDKGKAKVQPRQLDFKKAKIASAAIAGTGAGAGYLAGRNSGSKSAPTKSAPTKGGGGGSRRTAPKYVEPKGGNIASRTDNSDGSKVGPNMSKVNKPDAKSAVKKDSRSTMQKLFGASEDKRAMGRNQMNAARKSMGMKKGGNVKKYKKGGSIDGCAVKGHTRAKRSR